MAFSPAFCGGYGKAAVRPSPAWELFGPARNQSSISNNVYLWGRGGPELERDLSD